MITFSLQRILYLLVQLQHSNLPEAKMHQWERLLLKLGLKVI